MEMMSACSRFSTGERHFKCQEQHDPNGFHLGKKIALFVYTRAEQWVIASGGPNHNGSNEKFSTSQWDAELEKQGWKFWRTRFWVSGRDGEQNSLCWWDWRSRRLEQKLTDRHDQSVHSQHEGSVAYRALPTTTPYNGQWALIFLSDGRQMWRQCMSLFYCMSIDDQILHFM